MDTKEAIEFIKNDLLSIIIIDQKVDEYYKRMKNIIALLRRGEENEKYRTMWEMHEKS